jgi:uncharacterized protein (UPF0335 family)
MDEIVEELIESKLSDNILNRGALKLFVRGKVMETVGDLALLNKKAQESGNSKYQEIMNEILNVDRSLKEVRENTRKEREAKKNERTKKVNPEHVPTEAMKGIAQEKTELSEKDRKTLEKMFKELKNLEEEKAELENDIKNIDSEISRLGFFSVIRKNIILPNRKAVWLESLKKVESKISKINNKIKQYQNIKK